MAVGSSSTQQSLRTALDALKDSPKVGLTKAKSNDYKEVDVAVLKATNHVERLPKEKHIRSELNFRVIITRRWMLQFLRRQTMLNDCLKRNIYEVVLKTLIVMHRALREVGPNFREVLGEGYVLNLSHFQDDSSPEAWNYSASIRTYSLYLEEHLECYLILERDVEKDRSILSYIYTGHLLDELPFCNSLFFAFLLASQKD